MVETVDVETLTFLLEGKKRLRIAEIGCFECVSTLYLLNRFQIDKYYAIDPFEYYEKYDENGLKEKLNKDNDLYEQTLRKLKEYPNVKFIYDYSKGAVKYVQDGELDFCFIDGNHAYEYTLEDITIWFPKIKDNGILCGHDVDRDSVQKAVQEFFKDKKFDVFYGKRSWFVIKKEVYW